MGGRVWGFVTSGANMVHRMPGGGYRMSQNKYNKALLFSNLYQKNAFYILMWRLLLRSHLGCMLIFLSSHWCPSRGEKGASRPGPSDRHQLCHHDTGRGGRVKMTVFLNRERLWLHCQHPIPPPCNYCSQ